MSTSPQHTPICVIIGASHAGVTCAFALRKEGWEGKILLFDADPMLPYHRPPLSKAYLTSEDGIDQHLLKSAESYEKENIDLQLGKKVIAIDRDKKQISLADGQVQAYDKLVMATGARPLIPPISGIDSAKNLFPMRTAEDAIQIRDCIQTSSQKRVVIIGGGYIGLETAASLRKMGAVVTVLEREDRILARVTAPELSDFFLQLHTDHGVEILTEKHVSAIQSQEEQTEVLCADGSRFLADMIVVGCGIHVNQELAQEAGLRINNGIEVDASCRTNDEYIYAIGDCTFHHNPHYDRFVRLESVQNALDQAKVAAAAICGQEVIYDAIPWFWSDQYDIKLQMVGLSTGYTEAVLRREDGEQNCFSIWYFRDDTLLAVDAVNFPKAYVLGTRFIKGGQQIDKSKLVDPSIPFKPTTLLAQ